MLSVTVDEGLKSGRRLLHHGGRPLLLLHRRHHLRRRRLRHAVMARRRVRQATPRAGGALRRTRGRLVAAVALSRDAQRRRVLHVEGPRPVEHRGPGRAALRAAGGHRVALAGPAGGVALDELEDGGGVAGGLDALEAFEEVGEVADRVLELLHVGRLLVRELLLLLLLLLLGLVRR